MLFFWALWACSMLLLPGATLALTGGTAESVSIAVQIGPHRVEPLRFQATDDFAQRASDFVSSFEMGEGEGCARGDAECRSGRLAAAMRSQLEAAVFGEDEMLGARGDAHLLLETAREREATRLHRYERRLESLSTVDRDAHVSEMVSTATAGTDDNERAFWPLRFTTKEHSSLNPRTRCASPSPSSSLHSEVVFALGIVSAMGNTANRNAIRQTWLNAPNVHSRHVESRFFVGMREDGTVPKRVLQEQQVHGDILFVNITDTYANTPRKSVAVFHWGARLCGAYYVMRANDDVFVRLEPLMAQLFLHVPSRLYVGRIIDGGSMHVPRLEDFSDSQGELLAAQKVWAFARNEYPADVYPTFAQGNGYVLTRDLAEEVAKLVERPRFKLFADDVMIGLVVEAFQPKYLAVPTDYESEGRRTPCSEDALFHFDIHPEHMYDLFENARQGLPQCLGIVTFCCG